MQTVEIKTEITPFRLWKREGTMGLCVLNFHFSLLDNWPDEEAMFHRSENRVGFWHRLPSGTMLNIWFQVPIWVTNR